MATINSWNSSFDTSNLVFGLFPSALRNGTNFAAANAGTAYPFQGPSGGAITATLTNMTAGYGLVDQFGGVLRFDGVDDYCGTSYRPVFTNTSKWSLGLWVFYTSTASTQDLANMYVDNSNNLRISVASTNQLWFRFEKANSVDVMLSTDTLSDGWHYLVFRKDGSELTAHVDGSEVSGYDTQNPYALGDLALASDFNIGTYDGTPTDGWTGYISQVEVYEDALTPARILNNYNLGHQMDGIRASVSGNNCVLYDPADDAPSIVAGSAYKLGDAKYALPVVARSEFNSSAQTFVPLPINLANISAYWAQSPVADGSTNTIRMSTQTGTEIPIDITGYSQAGNTGWIWLRHPTLPNGTDADQLILQWGGSDTRATTDTDTYKSCYGGSTDYIAAYHLDEASGNAIDAVGNYDGTVSGATQDQTGKINKGYDFDGNNDNINIGTITQLDQAAAFTVINWMKQDVVAVQDEMFVFQIDGTNGIIWRTNTGGTGRIFFFVRNGAEGYVTCDYVDQGYAAGLTAFIGGVFNGALTGNQNRAKIFFQGADATFGDAATIPATTADYASETATVAAASNAFDGMLDEFRLIAGALTASQILLHFDYEDTAPVNAGWDVGDEAVVIPGGAIPSHISIYTGIAIR
jgi:hypothetical protein